MQSFRDNKYVLQNFFFSVFQLMQKKKIQSSSRPTTFFLNVS